MPRGQTVLESKRAVAWTVPRFPIPNSRTLLNALLEIENELLSYLVERAKSGDKPKKRDLSQFRDYIREVFYNKTKRVPKSKMIDGIINTVWSAYSGWYEHWEEWKNEIDELKEKLEKANENEKEELLKELNKAIKREPKNPRINNPTIRVRTKETVKYRTDKKDVFIVEVYPFKDNEKYKIEAPKRVSKYIKKLISMGYKPTELQLVYRIGESKVVVVLSKKTQPIKVESVMGIDINVLTINKAVVGLDSSILSLDVKLNKGIQRAYKRYAKAQELQAKFERKYGIFWADRCRSCHLAVRKYYKRANNIAKDFIMRLAKEISKEAYERKSAVVIENLKKIKHKKKKQSRGKQTKWDLFLRFRKHEFVQELKKWCYFYGIPVIEVNPAYTSQTDPWTKKKVEFIDERKRWAITSRGIINRDVLASLNIALRGLSVLVGAPSAPAFFSPGNLSYKLNHNK